MVLRGSGYGLLRPLLTQTVSQPITGGKVFIMKFGKFEIGFLELIIVVGAITYAIDKVAPLVMACK